ncbi:MAG: hypothetical protein ACYS99_13605 [Planctomycetota bacterium]
MTSTLHAKESEETPGLYVCTQLEAGTWNVYLSRDDLKVKRVKVDVKEGKTTEVSVTMTPK